MIEFVMWGVFTNAPEPYRKWRLPGGAPELGIGREMEVMEDRWDDGEPRFILRESETKKYGRELEDWEVRLLFAGEPPSWEPVGAFLAHLLKIDYASAREIRGVAGAVTKIEEASDVYTFPETPVEGAPAREDSEWVLRALGFEDGPHYGFYALKVAVPVIDARPGDVLAWESGSRDRVSNARGHVRQIDRSHYEAVAELLEPAGALVPLFQTYSTRRKGLSGSLRKSAAHAKRAKPESAPLHLLRPYNSPVSEPINAPSDTHAMFELLQQVGGRP